MIGVLCSSQYMIISGHVMKMIISVVKLKKYIEDMNRRKEKERIDNNVTKHNHNLIHCNSLPLSMMGQLGTITNPHHLKELSSCPLQKSELIIYVRGAILGASFLCTLS